MPAWGYGIDAAALAEEERKRKEEERRAAEAARLAAQRWTLHEQPMGPQPRPVLVERPQPRPVSSVVGTSLVERARPQTAAGWRSPSRDSWVQNVQLPDPGASYQAPVEREEEQYAIRSTASDSPTLRIESRSLSPELNVELPQNQWDYRKYDFRNAAPRVGVASAVPPEPDMPFAGAFGESSQPYVSNYRPPEPEPEKETPDWNADVPEWVQRYGNRRYQDPNDPSTPDPLAMWENLPGYRRADMHEQERQRGYDNAYEDFGKAVSDVVQDPTDWQAYLRAGQAGVSGALQFGGNPTLNSLERYFDVPTKAVTTTPIDQFLKGTTEPGTAPSLMTFLAPAGNAFMQTMRNPELARQFLNAPLQLQNAVPAMLNYGQVYLDEFERLTALNERTGLAARENPDAAFAFLSTTGGSESQGPTLTDILENPQRIKYLEEKAAQALQLAQEMAGRMDDPAAQETAARYYLNAAQLGAQAQKLHSMTPADIVDQYANLGAEIVEGVLFDPAEWVLGPIVHVGTSIQAARQLNKAAALFGVSDAQALTNLADAAKSAQPMLTALMQGEDINGWLQRVLRAGKEGKPGKAVQEATVLFAQTPQSRVAIDANWLHEAASSLFAGVNNKADAQAILNTWVNNPQQLVNGMTGLTSPALQGVGQSGVVAWGPGVLANTEVVKRYPILQLMKDQLGNLESLKTTTPWNAGEFFAELDDAIETGARMWNGTLPALQLPTGATSVRLNQTGNQLGNPSTGSGQVPMAILEFLDGKKKVLSTSLQLPLDNAKHMYEQYKWAATGDKRNWGEKVGQLVTKDFADLQRSIMSLAFLGLRPGNWIRNALSATVMLTGEDAFTTTPNSQIMGDLLSKFAVGPTDRIYQIQQGLVNATSAQANEGADSLTRIANKLFGEGNPITSFIDNTYKIPYGSTEIPLPGSLGSIPVGEQSFYLRAFKVPFDRTLRAVWTNAVTTDLLPKLLNTGVDAEAAQSIVGKIIDLGINGNKGEISAGLRKYLQQAAFTPNLKEMGIPYELLGLDGERGLLDLIATYTPDQLPDAQAALSTLIQGVRSRNAQILNADPTQAGVYDWTNRTVNNQGAMILKAAEEAAQHAGIDPQQAKVQAEATAKAVVGTLDSLGRLRNDLAGGLNNRHTWNATMDFWGESYRLWQDARQATDEAGLAASYANTAEVWAKKWRVNQEEWGGYAEKYNALVDKTRETIGRIAAGEEYESAFDWWNVVQKYAEWDEVEFRKARSFTPGSPSNQEEREAFQTLRDQNRQLVDNSFAFLFETFRQFPTLENFDVLTTAMRSNMLDGARVAEFLAEQRAKLLPNNASKYHAIRNAAWTQFFDNTAIHNLNYAQAVVRLGVQQAGEDVLKWQDDFWGEVQLRGPKNLELNPGWEVYVPDMKETTWFADPSAQNPGAPVVPQSVIDNYKRILEGQEPIVERVMAQVQEAVDALPAQPQIAAWVPSAEQRMAQLQADLKQYQEGLQFARQNGNTDVIPMLEGWIRDIEQKLGIAPRGISPDDLDDLDALAPVVPVGPRPSSPAPVGAAATPPVDAPLLSSTPQFRNLKDSAPFPFGKRLGVDKTGVNRADVLPEFPSPTQLPDVPAIDGGAKTREVLAGKAASIYDTPEIRALTQEYEQARNQLQTLEQLSDTGAEIGDEFEIAARYVDEAENSLRTEMGRVIANLAKEKGITVYRSTATTGFGNEGMLKSVFTTPTYELAAHYEKQMGGGGISTITLPPGTRISLIFGRGDTGPALTQQKLNEGYHALYRVDQGEIIIIDPDYIRQYVPRPIRTLGGYYSENVSHGFVGDATKLDVDKYNLDPWMDREYGSFPRRPKGTLPPDVLVQTKLPDAQLPPTRQGREAPFTKPTDEPLIGPRMRPMQPVRRPTPADLPNIDNLDEWRKWRQEWAAEGGAPPNAAPPTDANLRALAVDAGLVVTNRAGKPSDAYLRNAINADLGTQYKKLSQLSPRDRWRAYAALTQRAVDKAAADAAAQVPVTILETPELNNFLKAADVPEAPEPTFGPGGFFAETSEDLPIFSGAAPYSQEKAPFQPKETGRQESMLDFRPSMEAGPQGTMAPRVEVATPTPAPRNGRTRPTPSTEAQKAQEVIGSLEEQRAWMREVWANVVTQQGSKKIPKLDAMILRYNRGGVVNLAAQGDFPYEDILGLDMGGVRFETEADIEKFLSDYVKAGQRVKDAKVTLADTKTYAKMSAAEVRKAVGPTLKKAGISPKLIASSDRRALLDMLEGVQGKDVDLEFGESYFYSGMPALSPEDAEAISNFFGGVAQDTKAAFQDLWYNITQSRKTGGDRATTVSDVAAHNIETLNDVERRLLQMLPDLLAGKPNTVAPAVQLRVVDALDDFAGRYDEALSVARKVGKDTADWVMLNYGDKRNIDSILSLIFPYHYFWSRMPTRLAALALKKPGLVNLYYRTNRAIETENRRENVPPSREGTFPIWEGKDGAQQRMPNPLLFAIPWSQYGPNVFVDPSEAESDTERTILNVQQRIPGLFPTTQYALDMALDYYSPRKDGTKRTDTYQLGDFLPGALGRSIGYGRRMITGNMPENSFWNMGDELDPGRATSAAEAIALEQGMTDPYPVQYAQQIILNQSEGKSPFAGIPAQYQEQAAELAKAGVSRASGERALTTFISYLTGNPLYSESAGKQELAAMKRQYNSLGYDPNEFGSETAQRAYIDANPMITPGWSQNAAYPGADGPTPAQSVRTSQLYDEIDEIKAQRKQAEDAAAQAVMAAQGTPGDINDAKTAAGAPYKEQLDALYEQVQAIPKAGGVDRRAPWEVSDDFAKGVMQSTYDFPGKPADGASSKEWDAWAKAKEDFIVNTLAQPTVATMGEALQRGQGLEPISEDKAKLGYWRFLNLNNAEGETAYRETYDRQADQWAAEKAARSAAVEERIPGGSKLLDAYLNTPKGEARSALADGDWRYYAALMAAYDTEVYDAAVAEFGKDALKVYNQGQNGKPKHPGDSASDEALKAYFADLDKFNAKYAQFNEIELWVEGRYKWNQSDMQTSAPDRVYDAGVEWAQAKATFGDDIFAVEQEANAAKDYVVWLKANPDKYTRLVGYREWRKQFSEMPSSADELPQANWDAAPDASGIPASFMTQPPQQTVAGALGAQAPSMLPQSGAQVGGKEKLISPTSPESGVVWPTDPKTAKEWARENEKFADYEDKVARGEIGQGSEWAGNWDAYDKLGKDWAAKRQYMLDHPEFAAYYKSRGYRAWWEEEYTPAAYFGGGRSYGGGGGGFSFGSGRDSNEEQRMDAYIAPRGPFNPYMTPQPQDIPQWRRPDMDLSWLQAGQELRPDRMQPWRPLPTGG